MKIKKEKTPDKIEHQLDAKNPKSTGTQGGSAGSSYHKKGNTHQGVECGPNRSKKVVWWIKRWFSKGHVPCWNTIHCRVPGKSAYGQRQQDAAQ